MGGTYGWRWSNIATKNNRKQGKIVSDNQPQSINELRGQAASLGIRVRLGYGTHWYAFKADTIIAKERDERMVLVCSIARVKAGVFLMSTLEEQ